MKERNPILAPPDGPGLVTGALVAAMLTASLIAVFYLAWRVAGFPFVPFDVFDWMTRLLAGQALAAGTGAMVTVIRALNPGPTAADAKAAEQGMGIAGMFFTGTIAGTILFSIIRALRGRYAYSLGLALGIVMGVAAELISHRVSQTASVGPWLSAVWVLGAVLLWGVTLGWADRQLLAVAGRIAKPAAQPDGGDTRERIDRRRFLVRLGRASAGVAAVGAVVRALSRARRQRGRPRLSALCSST